MLTPSFAASVSTYVPPVTENVPFSRSTASEPVSPAIFRSVATVIVDALVTRPFASISRTGTSSIAP